jgi:hypothetical protein
MQRKYVGTMAACHVCHFWDTCAPRKKPDHLVNLHACINDNDSDNYNNYNNDNTDVLSRAFVNVRAQAAMCYQRRRCRAVPTPSRPEMITHHHISDQGAQHAMPPSCWNDYGSFGSCIVALCVCVCERMGYVHVQL